MTYRRGMLERRDCQYKDRSPWISTGNPRVMSHNLVMLYIYISVS
jgi:hypothetical protein